MLLQILTTAFTRPTATPYPITANDQPFDIWVVKELADGSYDKKEFTDLYQAILHQCRTGAEQLRVNGVNCGTAWIALDDARRKAFGCKIRLEVSEYDYGEVLAQHGRNVSKVICYEAGIKRLTEMLKILSTPRPKKAKRTPPVAWREGLERKKAPLPLMDISPLTAAGFVQAAMVVPDGIKLYLHNFTSAEQAVLYDVEAALAASGLKFTVKKTLYTSKLRKGMPEPGGDIREVCYTFPLTQYYDLLDLIPRLMPKYAELLAAKTAFIAAAQQPDPAMSAYYDAHNEDDFEEE